MSLVLDRKGWAEPQTLCAGLMWGSPGLGLPTTPTSRFRRLVPRGRQNLFICSQLSPREDELVAREVLNLEMVA